MTIVTLFAVYCDNMDEEDDMLMTIMTKLVIDGGKKYKACDKDGNWW